MTTLSADVTLTDENSEHLSEAATGSEAENLPEVLDPPAYVTNRNSRNSLDLTSAHHRPDDDERVAIAIPGGSPAPEALRGDADLLTSFLLFSPLFLILAAERIWTKKKGGC